MASKSIPKTMRSIMKKAEEKSYVLEDIDVPQPVGNEVLICVDAVAICGSDIALYMWNDLAKTIASIPFIPGHETAGTIVKVGPESTLKVIGITLFVGVGVADGHLLREPPKMKFITLRIH